MNCANLLSWHSLFPVTYNYALSYNGLLTIQFYDNLIEFDNTTQNIL